MRIANQKVVSIDYTLTDTEGDILDTSKGSQPLAYMHGAGNIIPGLEAALNGKAVGETIKVTIPPEKAYGQHDPKMVQVVPRDRFPADAKVEAGVQFQAQTPQGARVVTIAGVEGDSVRVDANHPLAGVTLNFEVLVVDVREPTAEELAHGHVHGPGGHAH